MIPGLARRLHRLAWIVVIGFVSLPLVALLILSGLAALAQNNVYFVEVRNDTSMTVIIEMRCDEPDAPCNYRSLSDGRLPPGASISSLTVGAGNDDQYRVVEPSGQVIGCLPLQSQKTRDGSSVLISQVTKCGPRLR